MWLVAFLATALRRAASGNNNRLSTLWREVISLAGVARSLSKASSYRNFQRRNRHGKDDARLRSQEARYAKQRRNPAIVQESGGAIEIKSEVGVGTAVRMMMLPVSRLADGNCVDLSNSIAAF
jgi:hypothetical protein